MRPYASRPATTTTPQPAWPPPHTVPTPLAAVAGHRRRHRPASRQPAAARPLVASTCRHAPRRRLPTTAVTADPVGHLARGWPSPPTRQPRQSPATRQPSPPRHHHHAQVAPVGLLPAARRHRRSERGHRRRHRAPVAPGTRHHRTPPARRPPVGGHCALVSICCSRASSSVGSAA
ncbi:uncharacterized protein A4U43_C09F2780 [Asparagus officinalis]|uniref:Uncharacterized protein n=1 Tax=Asparagus officinalis TaxID=4686 RepID=A0A5P1E4V6_ASPOF|nr:uncharacterized protein A4U43_C09F2780 [Asparagus officinalis]